MLASSDLVRQVYETYVTKRGVVILAVHQLSVITFPLYPPLPSLLSVGPIAHLSLVSLHFPSQHINMPCPTSTSKRYCPPLLYQSLQCITSLNGPSVSTSMRGKLPLTPLLPPSFVQQQMTSSPPSSYLLHVPDRKHSYVSFKSSLIRLLLNLDG